MRNGVGADRDQRVIGERFEFIPGHAKIAGNRGLIDAVGRAQRRDLAANILIAR